MFSTARVAAAALVAVAATALTPMVVSSAVLPAAHADDNLAYQAPVKVVVDSAKEEVPWSLVGSGIDAVKQTTAELDLVSPFHEADFQYFYGQTSDTLIWSPPDPVGRYMVNGLAFDADAEETWEPTTAYLWIRYASRATLTGTRDGDGVSLRGVIQRFSTGATPWVGNGGVTVKLQHLTPTGWAALSTRTSPAGGNLYWNLNREQTTYRLVVSASAQVWNSISAPFTL